MSGSIPDPYEVEAIAPPVIKPGVNVVTESHAVMRHGYCYNCHYSLRGLSGDRCPECGRYFNRDDPGTYLAEPHDPWHRDLVKTKARSGTIAAILLTLGVTLSLLTGLIGYVAWVILYPFWLVVTTRRLLDLLANERFTGLIFWLYCGGFVGMTLGAVMTLLSATGGFSLFVTYWFICLGVTLGVFAGLLRERAEILGILIR